MTDYLNEVSTLSETRDGKSVIILLIETNMPLSSLHPGEFPEEYMGQLKWAKQEVAERHDQGKTVGFVRIREKTGTIVREYVVADLL
jgi:hypothetical protein